MKRQLTLARVWGKAAQRARTGLRWRARGRVGVYGDGQKGRIKCQTWVGGPAEHWQCSRYAQALVRGLPKCGVHGGGRVVRTRGRMGEQLCFGEGYGRPLQTEER